MTKAEILEAINATIAPNGVKGITAESLANILTEIVNAAGEGGAGGEYLDMTPANPNDPTSMELTTEAMAHNAEVYAKLLEASNTGKNAPQISMGADGFIVYAQGCMLVDSAFVLYFAMPLNYDFKNYIVEGLVVNAPGDTNQDQLIIGSQVGLIMVTLYSDGSLETSIPGID